MHQTSPTSRISPKHPHAQSLRSKLHRPRKSAQQARQSLQSKPQRPRKSAQQAHQSLRSKLQCARKGAQ